MLYSTAQKENLDVVYFDALLRYETHEIEEKFEHSKQYYNTPLFLQKAVTGQDLFLRLKHNNIYRPSACLQILKREFLLSTGEKFYEGIIYEDNLFTFKTMLQAKRVMKLDEQLYIRLYRADSIMTSARTIKNLRSYLRCVSQMMAFSENFPADDILKKEMAHSISQLCLRINEIYKKLPAEEKEKAKMFNPLEQMWLNMTLTKKPGRMKTVVRKFSTLIHRCKDYGVWQTMKYVWGKIFH